jgi:prepilin-type N-terminal cleavage/methylation domain-containing protein
MKERKEQGTGDRSQGARRGGDAFTLMELMATVAIIAVLAGLTLGTLGYVNKKGAESRARSEIATLSAAIDNYKLDFGSYPAANTTQLYKELTGQGTNNKTKVFIEPTPGMVTNTVNGPFVDPWGLPYEYRTGQQATNNVGFFDLWSTAGGTESAKFIRN